MYQKRIEVWHGESGTRFYVVRYNPANDADWEIVATRRTREAAEKLL